MDDTEYQTTIHSALQESVNSVRDGDDAGVVTKWVAIVEVMKGDYKTLHTFRADHLSCSVWDVKGMLHQILYDSQLFEDDGEG